MEYDESYISYLIRIKESFNYEMDFGPEISLTDQHVKNVLLWEVDKEVDEAVTNKCKDVPNLVPIILHHFAAVRHLGNSRFVEAFRAQAKCLEATVNMLEELADNLWCAETVGVISSDFRVVAYTCDLSTASSKKILDQAIQHLEYCAKLYSRKNASKVVSKYRLHKAYPVSQLFKTYFTPEKQQINLPKLPSSTEFVNSHFYTGRALMTDGDYTQACYHFEVAMRLCDHQYRKNKQTILIYLMVTKTLSGNTPKMHFTPQFDLAIMRNLLTAVDEGKVYDFEGIVWGNQDYFSGDFKYTIPDLRILTYRNVFRHEYKFQSSNIVHLLYFRDGLELMSRRRVSAAETKFHYETLFSLKKLNSNLCYRTNAVYFYPEQPFPNLNNKRNTTTPSIGTASTSQTPMLLNNILSFPAPEN